MEYESKTLKENFEKRQKLYNALDVYTAEIKLINKKISKELIDNYAGKEIAFVPGNDVEYVDRHGELHHGISSYENFQIVEILSSNSQRELYFTIRNMRDEDELYQIKHNNFHSFQFVEL